MRTWEHKTKEYSTARNIELAISGYFMGLGFECLTDIQRLYREDSYKLVVEYGAMFDKTVILEKIARELG